MQILFFLHCTIPAGVITAHSIVSKIEIICSIYKISLVHVASVPRRVSMFSSIYVNNVGQLARPQKSEACCETLEVFA